MRRPEAKTRATARAKTGSENDGEIESENESGSEHEKLDCYRLSRQVARWLKQLRFDRGDADLRDQALRAARSTVLNIAEGCGKTGKSRRYHYGVALGSAAETCAALDLVDDAGVEAQQKKLRRIGMMLYVMRK